MDIKKAILERRSIRDFKKGIKKQDLESLLNNARYAPSSGNLQLWKVVAITEPDIKEKLIHNAGGFPIMKNATPVYFFYKQNNYSIYEADIQSTAAFIQNLLLLAYKKKISSLWLYKGGGEIPKVKKILNIPSNYYFCACVLLGYSNAKPKPPERKLVSEFLSYNSFAEPSLDPFKKSIAYLDNIIYHMSPFIEGVYPFGKPSQFSREIIFFTKTMKGKIGEFLPISGTHSVSLIQELKLKDYSIFEYSKQCERFTKERLSKHFKKLKLKPFKKLDSVFCAQKLEFYPPENYSSMIEDVKKGLKKGGTFSVSFRNIFSFYSFYWFLKYVILQKKDWQKFTPINPFYLLSLLHKKEFKIKSVRCLNNLPFNPLTMLFSKIITIEAVKLD